MANCDFQNDPAMQQYFQTLPAFVQESIKQSGVDLKNLQEMQDFVKHLNKQ